MVKRLIDKLSLRWALVLCIVAFAGLAVVATVVLAGVLSPSRFAGEYGVQVALPDGRIGWFFPEGDAPSALERALNEAISVVVFGACIILAAMLFYRMKLREPLS